ncbi:hypothetical protein CS063_02340 [Sporanaerobium hydrogeniformans]|uniref:Uncharacterized protein n=1 Tax=Sporanaerobium hydrogeniformans TaxID=3072179 RepID=A0AC61DIH5_9FIRM|nr:prepilin peptidase [Sporanaerobium hydrogeniformans]PHV72336.1 hypothetical protein CS063_02340 [Sporanaerobium hydrogeniformans]
MLNSILFFILGLVIGSFLNVCIYRLPKGESLIYPGSHCTHCGHALSTYDLIPIVSYCCLNGKCRYCKEKISPYYALVEGGTGLLYALLFHTFGWSLELPLYMLFISILIVLTLIDWEYMLLPTPILVFGCVLGSIFRGLQAARYQNTAYLWAPLLGALVGFGLFFCSLFCWEMVL